MTGERNELYEAHWLDKAKTKFTLNEVEDVKAALKVLVVFIPLIFFWAVFFQVRTMQNDELNAGSNTVARLSSEFGFEFMGM